MLYIVGFMYPLVTAWSLLPVATSTLAMGVNLPAHLVVVKSTEHYVMGVYQEYPEAQVSQMIGRAGRPQVWKYILIPEYHVINSIIKRYLYSRVSSPLDRSKPFTFHTWQTCSF